MATISEMDVEEEEVQESKNLSIEGEDFSAVEEQEEDTSDREEREEDDKEGVNDSDDDDLCALASSSG